MASPATASADVLHQQGLASKQALDMEAACERFAAAAALGHAGAQVELARMQLHGIGCEVDAGAAIGWLERAEPASPIASYLLALVASGDSALPRDARMDARLLAAANAGLAPALLASAVHFGRKPQPEAQAACMRLLGAAAQRGHAIAALLLERRLELGEGCERDARAAEALRRQLAQSGIERLPDTPFDAPGAQDDPAPLEPCASRIVPPAMELRATRPRIATCERLLSADECRLLIAHARLHLRPSRTVHPLTGAPLSMPLRTSSGATFDPLLEDIAIRLVQARMAVAAGLPLVNAEHLTVLRYAPGEEYRPHRDALPPASIQADHPQAGNRIRTLCAYLNPVAAGGETEFPAPGVRIIPRAGCAVAFDNLGPDGFADPDSLHAGLPVERGEKWLATLWLRERRYRDF